MANPNKDQQEIPGAERPSDATLDALCYTMLQAKAKQDAAKEEFEDDRAKAIDYMRNNAIELYVYRDGDRRFALEYEANENVKLKEIKPKRRKAAD